MLWYGFPWPWIHACSAKVSTYPEPLLHIVDHHMLCVFPHTIEQDSQPTTTLSGKQVIPYRTRGGTCSHVVSTSKIQSLADSSMTNHITWRNLTVPTIPTYAQTTTSNLTTVNSHLDGWKTNLSHKDTSHTQHHKDGRLVRLSWL
jgi:hypothetical protein